MSVATAKVSADIFRDISKTLQEINPEN
jgi:hypothetical protein